MLRHIALLILFIVVCYAQNPSPIPTPDCSNNVNECYDSWNGQFCVDIMYKSPNVTKHCRKCDPTLDTGGNKRSFCSCGMGEYCYGDPKDPHFYGTCKGMSPTGQKCDPRVTTDTANNIKWNVNHKYFCGGVTWNTGEEVRPKGESARYILWRGACVDGYCRVCNSGGGGQAADYDSRSCGDGSGCFKFVPTYALAGTNSWSLFGDNALIFIQFWFAIIIGGIIVVSFLCFVIQGKFKKDTTAI